MIEIPLSTITAIAAIVFCGMQIFGLVTLATAVRYGLFSSDKNKEGLFGFMAFIGIAAILLGDFVCLWGSHAYMTTPTESRCYFYNGDDCHYPSITDNPFERQPIHPIRWTFDLMSGFFNLLHKEVKFT